MSTYHEYPGTPRVQPDDVAPDTATFEGKEVVVVEKLGGESTPLHPDDVNTPRARNLEGRSRLFASPNKGNVRPFPGKSREVSRAV